MTVKGKVAVVTASTRGIGWACAEALAREGAVVYLAARNKEAAKERIAQLKEKGCIGKWVYCDASKKESYAALAKEVEKEEGRIDILVNNFGTSDPATDLDIEHTDYDRFMNTLDQNLSSVYLSVQAVLPVMKRQGSGSIINISSIGGLIPDISRIGYAVSKDAIIYLSKNIALQEAKNGIRVNVVCPGQIATDAVKNNMSESFQELFTRHTPAGRMGEPEEIAAAVLYFASEEAAYTTGQVLAVSGGFGLGTPVYGELAKLSADKRH